MVDEKRPPLHFWTALVLPLLGRLSIYLFQVLNAPRWNYPLYKIDADLSLIYVAFCHNLPGFPFGHLFGDLMGELATPPLFNCLVTPHVFGGVGKWVALFNSVFAPDYVLESLLLEGLQGIWGILPLLLLSWHWGYATEFFATRGQQQVFRSLAEARLDLLWDHHSHLPQATYQQGGLWRLTLECQADGRWFCTEIVPHFCSLQNGVLSPPALAQNLLYSFFQEPAHATAV